MRLLPDEDGCDSRRTLVAVIIGHFRPARPFITLAVDNDDVVEFDYAESDWGVITHVGVFDSLTGGNLLDYAELDNEADIKADTQFWIDEGGYRIEWGD